MHSNKKTFKKNLFIFLLSFQFKSYVQSLDDIFVYEDEKYLNATFKIKHYTKMAFQSFFRGFTIAQF